MPTVALDGRGAERGPEAIVAGVRAAAADGIRLRVFGDPAALAPVERIAGVELVPALEEITNDEEPVAAVRSRQGASVVLAARDVAEGRSQAMASAGSTGATMTAALFACGVCTASAGPRLPSSSSSRAGLGRPRCCSTWGRTPMPGRTTWCSSPIWALRSARPCSGLLGRGWRCSPWARRPTRDRRRWWRRTRGCPTPQASTSGATSRAGSCSPGGRRDRHRRVHRQRRPEDDRGNREGRRRCGARCGALRPRGGGGRVSAASLTGRPAPPARSGRDRRRGPARPPGRCGGRPRQSGPDGIANAVRLAARTSSESAVERTARLLDQAGMTFGVIGKRDERRRVEPGWCPGQGARAPVDRAGGAAAACCANVRMSRAARVVHSVTASVLWPLIAARRRNSIVVLCAATIGAASTASSGSRSAPDPVRRREHGRGCHRW